jgi:glycylpeptide N-tetradecanoyltransferase
MLNQIMSKHQFWSTQPVSNSTETSGFIDETLFTMPPPESPQRLPSDFEWTTLDTSNKSHIQSVIELLSKHYVSSEEGAKLLYTNNFFTWFFSQNHSIAVGVRVVKTKKLVGFIFGSTGTVHVPTHENLKVAEIDFLCIHPKLRNKRLAPVLIKEITRQFRLKNIHCAIYTAGTKIPIPYVTHTYHHRPINIDQLCKVGFLDAQSIAQADTLKIRFKILPRWNSAGIHVVDHTKPPTDALIHDISHLSQIAQSSCLVKHVMTKDTIKHLLSAPLDVLQTIFITDPNSGDMVAFAMVYFIQYIYPNNRSLRVAQLYHHGSSSPDGCKRLMKGILARIKRQADVLNVLDGAQFETLKDTLDLVPGQHLYSYFWNYKLPEMKPHEDGVLLF